MVAPDNVNRLLMVAVPAGAVAILLLIAFTDVSSGLWPRCMFHSLTGLECPGCGSQRAVHALMHGEIALAWSYNPLIFILAPLIPLMLAVSLMPRRLGRLGVWLESRQAALTLLFLIVIWTIVRNLFLRNPSL